MSKLLDIDSALIPQKKIVNYLLSETHDGGRDKANFFKRFGFTTEPGDPPSGATAACRAARDSQGRTFTIRKQICD